MRSLALVVALLFFVPAVAGQEPGQGPPGQPPGQGQGGNGTAGNGAGNGTAGNAACRDAEDRRACMEAYCEENPEDRSCRGPDACRGPDCAAASQACVEGRQPACAEMHELDDIRVDARFVTFEVGDDGRTLHNYTAGGTLLAHTISYGQDNTSFEVDQHGARIRFTSDSARLEIHDTPTGDFWFRGASSDTLVLTLPSDAALSAAPRGYLIDYGQRTARLAGANLTVDGQNVTADGHFTFFSTVGRGPVQATDALEQAKAAQRIGAEISLQHEQPNVTAYDEIDINVTMPALITANETLRVRLDANLSEGRTFVVDVDPARLAGPDLELRYFDVHGDNQTEVVFRQAGSLEDVLDPSDDGGQPEYWVVRDDLGLHVMVSVPVWSVHIIELASVGEFLVQPSVLIGIAAGMAGVGAAGVAMFWPRRRDEQWT